MRFFYQICFFLGLGYAVFSFLLGHLLGALHLGDIGSGEADSSFGVGAGDLGSDAGHGDFHLHGGADAHLVVSPFKPNIIAAFFGVYGGAGWLGLIWGFEGYLSFIIASVSGFFISYIMYRFIYVPLYRAQNTSAVEIQSLVGAFAKVSEKIPKGDFGKITYHANGNTYTAPAKSDSGLEISRETPVVITSIVKNVYFVAPKS